ncbi:MAG TPA: chemotaxis protein CheW [Gallionella sp.]|nr:chemotaxis protein CheW [Gallionella sp.]
MRELLLTSFDGRQYGIWKDAILSVKDQHVLHRIPLSPARIAGIMILDGQTVTLADLSASIGYDPSPASDHGRILLLAQEDKTTGFVASGELRIRSIAPESIFPLPDCLKTPVFDTCAVLDGIPVPIINIAELYSRALNPGKEPAGISFGLLPTQHREMFPSERIRFFSAAGDSFAVAASGMGDQAVKPGPVTPLPNTPRYLKGVAFHDGRLLTVIDLTWRVKRLDAAPGSLMLIANIAGTKFGFLIDGDEGAMPADDVSVKPVPLIAQTSWMEKAVLRAGAIIPLIDLAMALTPDSCGTDERPVWQRYVPDSRFPDLLFKEAAEVVEFSLLGVRYALPKGEVEEVVALKPSRVLPDVAPIVIGVTEHNGEILPVVDLAMMFGRRSVTRPDWRMMLVHNGDFRALVITEAVLGERRLPIDMHRAVPIHLPHNLMYGCYPDANKVTIILNVEAISVHFEKSLIQIFMPALSHEMRMSPTGVVYTFPEETASPTVLDTGQPSAKSTPAQTGAETVSEIATADELSPAVPLFKHLEQEQEGGFAGQEERNADAAAIAHEVEPVEYPAKKEISAGTQEPPAVSEEGNAGVAFGQEYIQRVSENAIAEETRTSGAESQELISPVDLSARASIREEGIGHGPEIAGKRTPLEQFMAAAKKKRAKPKAATAISAARPSKPEPTGTSYAPAGPHHSNRETERIVASSVNDDQAAGGKWKPMIAYGVIVTVLIAVFHFSGFSEKPVVETNAKGTEPVKIERDLRPDQPVTGNVQDKPKVEPEKEKVDHAGMEAGQAIATVEPEAKVKHEAKEKARQTLVLSPLADEQAEPRPAGKSRAPLELDIPESRPVDIDVYVVRRGDTLWSISERFTGSPYNYPRIAGENRIAEPDLIFPGQKIRLVK